MAEPPPPPKPLTKFQRLSTADMVGFVCLALIMFISFGLVSTQLVYGWFIFDEPTKLCNTKFEDNQVVQGFDQTAELDVLRQYMKWKFDEHRPGNKAKLFLKTRRSELDESVRARKSVLRDDFTDASHTKTSNTTCDVTHEKLHGVLRKDLDDDVFDHKEATLEASKVLKLDASKPNATLTYNQFVCFYAMSHGIDVIGRAIKHKELDLNQNTLAIAEAFMKKASFNATVCSIDCVTKGEGKHYCYEKAPNADGTKPKDAGEPICKWNKDESYLKDMAHCDYIEFAHDYEKSGASLRLAFLGAAFAFLARSL